MARTAHARRCVKQGAHGLSALEQVLEVVHDKQQMLLTEVVDDCLERLSARLVPELERPSDGGRHEAWIGDRTEVDEVHAVGVAVAQVSRDLQREAGLSCSAGTGQREEPHLAHEIDELSDQSFTANE